MNNLEPGVGVQTRAVVENEGIGEDIQLDSIEMEGSDTE
jgi:hypothetical protein